VNRVVLLLNTIILVVGLLHRIGQLVVADRTARDFRPNVGRHAPHRRALARRRSPSSGSSSRSAASFPRTAPKSSRKTSSAPFARRCCSTARRRPRPCPTRSTATARSRRKRNSISWQARAAPDRGDAQGLDPRRRAGAAADDGGDPVRVNPGFGVSAECHLGPGTAPIGLLRMSVARNRAQKTLDVPPCASAHASTMSRRTAHRLARPTWIAVAKRYLNPDAFPAAMADAAANTPPQEVRVDCRRLRVRVDIGNSEAIVQPEPGVAGRRYRLIRDPPAGGSRAVEGGAPGAAALRGRDRPRRSSA